MATKKKKAKAKPIVDGASAMAAGDEKAKTSLEDVAKSYESTKEDPRDLPPETTGEPLAEEKPVPSGPAKDMRPHYECHKKVYAHKIAGVKVEPDGSRLITPAEPGFSQIRVLRKFAIDHDVKPGSYLVYYEDGYVSISPAKAFENGYTLIEG